MSLEPRHRLGGQQSASRAAKKPMRARRWKSMILKPRHRYGRQHSASRASVNANLLSIVGLEEFAIHARNILACGGKLVSGRLAIIKANYLDLRQKRNWNRFEFRTGGPATGKPSAVKIDENAMFVSRRYTGLRRVNECVYTSDRRVFFIERKFFIVTV